MLEATRTEVGCIHGTVAWHLFRGGRTTHRLSVSKEAKESRGTTSSSLTMTVTYSSISTHSSSFAHEGHAKAQPTASGACCRRRRYVVMHAIPAPRECPVTTHLNPVSLHRWAIMGPRLSANHRAEVHMPSCVQYLSSNLPLID